MPSCEHCTAPYQHVKHDKWQPTCDCCPQCGTPGYRYYEVGESPFRGVSGWLCLPCTRTWAVPQGTPRVPPLRHERIEEARSLLDTPEEVELAAQVLDEHSRYEEAAFLRTLYGGLSGGASEGARG